MMMATYNYALQRTAPGVTPLAVSAPPSTPLTAARKGRATRPAAEGGR
jgi:hypothetical protein